MNTSIFIVFIIGILLGGIVGYFFVVKLGKKVGKENTDSLSAAREAKQQQKETAKRKVLTLFSSNDRIANNDVEKLLGVSDATATNYLDELEVEGRIEQRGKNGRGVFYTKING